MKLIRTCCGIGALAAALCTVAAGQTARPDDTSRFTILVRNVRTGSEVVTVTRTPDGWIISASGRQDPPVDLVTTKFEMTYDADWQPQALAIEGQVRGQLITLAAKFSPTSAVSDMLQGGQKSMTSHSISPRSIVLPNNFYGAFEALAARLGASVVGARLPVYVAPQAEIVATVDRVTPRRIITPSGPINLRQFDLTFNNPGAPLALQVTIDDRSRLARVLVPAAALSVVRDDISSVMAREETMRNAGDEDVFIRAAGFNLAATITTTPAGATGPRPAVVLVAGSGPQDRDETVADIPIFGQLAGAIADAGFLVVRYDKRGVGQSGGRFEQAGLDEYAADVVGIVSWLRQRKDVDPNRIAVVGHSEGGAVALLAARREKRVAAIALVAAPGQTGRDVTIWQQQHLLDLQKDTPDARQAKIALQQRLMNAVVTGTGWQDIPASLRDQADTAWFRSWLLFDPARVLAGLRQPVLIVQGSLDTQIPPSHADRLEALSRGRKNIPAAATRKVIVPGINHLLVPATTGEVDEYPRLPTRTISPLVADAVTGWLKDVLPPKKR